MQHYVWIWKEFVGTCFVSWVALHLGSKIIINSTASICDVKLIAQIINILAVGN